MAGIRTFGFYNAGQDCTAACRIYAQGKIYDKFVAAMTEAVASIKVGSQREEGGGDGAAHLRPAAQPGGQLRGAGPEQRPRGGDGRRQDPPGNGFFFEPTLIAHARQEDEIVRREVFGPVVSVTRFSDAEQVVQGQRLDYGLASSVWTRDLSLASKVASHLQYGCTWINTHFMLTSEMPHGGMKMSGYGKDLPLRAGGLHGAAPHHAQAVRLGQPNTKSRRPRMAGPSL